ncbi:hypothetical protein E7T06_11465 [Deinococcus sp. Arct2-2]|uniref:hypothetical protein n=1 Tax=Deinococcus sp. Arct2-2 TaxID=2568653 RepID=UPI0010A3CB75|nr:hypothetical protein [Deinococcus sp. Arct2-2]THF69523.1 hypothetical protein E7T06_11465 [Deinococcus sp. Arct2-2]
MFLVSRFYSGPRVISINNIIKAAIQAVFLLVLTFVYGSSAVGYLSVALITIAILAPFTEWGGYEYILSQGSESEIPMAVAENITLIFIALVLITTFGAIFVNLFDIYFTPTLFLFYITSELILARLAVVNYSLVIRNSQNILINRVDVPWILNRLFPIVLVPFVELEKMLLMVCILNCIFSLFFASQVKKLVSLNFRRINLNKRFKFGIAFGASSVAVALSGNVPSLILSQQISADKLGVFYIVYRIYNIGILPLSSYFSSQYPIMFSTALRNINEVIELGRAVRGTALKISFISSVIMLLGGFLLKFAVEDEVDIFLLTLAFTLSIPFFAIFTAAADTMTSMNFNTYRTILQYKGSLTTIFVAVVSVESFGVYAVPLSIFSGLFVMSFIISKRMKELTHGI